MAMLLALYQKMRLIREKNQTTYDLTRFSSKYDRVSKNIERVQKMYTARMSKLESQAKQMQNNASIFFRNAFGLGTSQINTNMYSYMGGGQLTGFMLNQMGSLFDANGNFSFKYGKENDQDGTLTKAEYDRFLSIYTARGQAGVMYQIDDDGKIITGEDGKPLQLEGEDSIKAQAFLNMVQNASMAQNQAQMALSTTSQNYENNISIWLEAAKEELEAEQDAALEPLAYEQTMWELEKTQAEQKLERIKADLESYKQLCSEETKESAPKFGLG